MSSPDHLCRIATDVFPTSDSSRSVSPVPSGLAAAAAAAVATDDDDVVVVVRNSSIVNCQSPRVHVCLEHRSGSPLNVSPKLDVGGGAVVDRLTDFSIDALLKSNRQHHRSASALPLLTDGRRTTTTKDWSVVRARHGRRIHTDVDVAQLEYSCEGGDDRLKFYPSTTLFFAPDFLRPLPYQRTSQLQEHLTTKLPVEKQSDDVSTECPDESLSSGSPSEEVCSKQTSPSCTAATFPVSAAESRSIIRRPDCGCSVNTETSAIVDQTSNTQTSRKKSTQSASSVRPVSCDRMSRDTANDKYSISTTRCHQNGHCSCSTRRERHHQDDVLDVDHVAERSTFHEHATAGPEVAELDDDDGDYNDYDDDDGHTNDVVVPDVMNDEKTEDSVGYYRKKTRTVFSKVQVGRLEATFDFKRYLSSTERSRLAAELRLTDTQIKIWFQNRRNKWKRQLLQNGVETSGEKFLNTDASVVQARHASGESSLFIGDLAAAGRVLSLHYPFYYVGLNQPPQPVARFH